MISLTLLSAPLLAQNAKPAAKASTTKIAAAKPWRHECLAEGGVCFEAPSAWRLVASPSKTELNFVEIDAARKAEELAALTLVEFALPESKDKPAPSAAEMMALILPSLVKDSSAETLERGRVMIEGHSCETLVIRAHLTDGERVEHIALIDMDEGKFIVVALTATPANADKLRPVFQHALESLRIAEADASAR